MSARRSRLFVLTVVVAMAITAGCGGSSGSDHAGHGSMAGDDMSGDGMSGAMPGMTHGSTAPSDGLAGAQHGFRFDLAASPGHVGRGGQLRFAILGPDGTPVTDYEPIQTKQLHLYVIRNDLTGYQHLHPTMDPRGVWQTPITIDQGGGYRAYAQFSPMAGDDMPGDLTLSRPFAVDGPGGTAPVPPVSDTARTGGLSVQLQSARLAMGDPLRAHISYGGTAVRDLEPYLDAYAHVTAFAVRDGAVAHMHPDQLAEAGAGGGPDLSFATHAVPRPGRYRVFIQLQRDGRLTTVPVTVEFH